jgi:hypothetical protein
MVLGLATYPNEQSQEGIASVEAFRKCFKDQMKARPTNKEISQNYLYIKETYLILLDFAYN